MILNLVWVKYPKIAEKIHWVNKIASNIQAKSQFSWVPTETFFKQNDAWIEYDLDWLQYGI